MPAADAPAPDRRLLPVHRAAVKRSQLAHDSEPDSTSRQRLVARQSNPPLEDPLALFDGDARTRVADDKLRVMSRRGPARRRRGGSRSDGEGQTPTHGAT